MCYREALTTHLELMFAWTQASASWVFPKGFAVAPRSPPGPSRQRRLLSFFRRVGDVSAAAAVPPQPVTDPKPRHVAAAQNAVPQLAPGTPALSPFGLARGREERGGGTRYGTGSSLALPPAGSGVNNTVVPSSPGSPTHLTPGDLGPAAASNHPLAGVDRVLFQTGAAALQARGGLKPQVTVMKECNGAAADCSQQCGNGVVNGVCNGGTAGAATYPAGSGDNAMRTPGDDVRFLHRSACQSCTYYLPLHSHLLQTAFAMIVQGRTLY